MPDFTETALAAIRQLRLPDGRCYGETFPDDLWIEESVLRPILAHNAEGLPANPVVWIELARGHLKTSAVAAVAIAEAVANYGTHIFCLAADADQARLVVEAVAGQARRNPKLGALFRQSRDEFKIPRTGSKITVMASDVVSFFGIGVDARRLRIVCDELSQWRSRDLYDAAQTTLPKVPDHQLIVITNAGIVGTWQEEARRQAEASGYLFAAPGVIASWIKLEDLERVRLSVPDAVYRRYFGNEWVAEGGSFITREALARCIDGDLTQRLRGTAGQTYAVGVDLGLTRDRTARAVCHYDRLADRVVLDSLRVWQGTRAAPVEIAAVEDDLSAMHDAFGAPVILCDPWQFAASIQRLRWVLNVREFTFSGGGVGKLSETLFSLISSGKLALYPDAALEAELVGLVARQTSYGWRIDHRSGRFSDRATALALACYGCLEGSSYGKIFTPQDFERVLLRV